MNGKTVSEEFYEFNADGWMTYLKKEIHYFEDGSKTVIEYDENWNIVSQKQFDADGNEIEAPSAE